MTIKDLNTIEQYRRADADRRSADQTSIQTPTLKFSHQSRQNRAARPLFPWRNPVKRFRFSRSCPAGVSLPNRTPSATAAGSEILGNPVLGRMNSPLQ
jgi:hypothetical protein